MPIFADNLSPDTLFLLVGVLGVLILATGVGFALDKVASRESMQVVVANLNARIRAWWLMCAVLAVALVAGRVILVVLYAAISIGALREFISLLPRTEGDRRVMLYAFWVLTPLQYVLVGFGRYELFSVLIPVLGFLLIPVRNALVGETENFVERTAGIQWGLMICVYAISFAPALLTLPVPGEKGAAARLLLFLIIVVQGSDVLQYIWGKLFGKHRIAPTVSPNKTWEGFMGGVASATLLGTLLWWATPFTPWQAAVVSLILCLLGFGGGLTMSAIKRDRGVKDFGTIIEGHGGLLDRIDSLCFAAPVFFQIVHAFAA